MNNVLAIHVKYAVVETIECESFEQAYKHLVFVEKYGEAFPVGILDGKTMHVVDYNSHDFFETATMEEIESYLLSAGVKYKEIKTIELNMKV